MGAEISCMVYKATNDTKTALYDYSLSSDSKLNDSVDLRRYCKHTVVCEQLPSHPAISLVHALICLSNVNKRHMTVPSSLNIFYESGGDCECGTNTLSCFEVLSRGVCAETEYPYSEEIEYDKETVPPPTINIDDVCIKRVDITTRGFCEPLMNNCPVIVTVRITEELYDSGTFTGDDDVVGDLTFVIVGYNIHDDAFTVQDSHKMRFLTLPSQYIINNTYCYDAYALCPGTPSEVHDAPMFLEASQPTC
jgi:Papain family cysteine protease.